MEYFGDELPADVAEYALFAISDTLGRVTISYLPISVPRRVKTAVNSQMVTYDHPK